MKLTSRVVMLTAALVLAACQGMNLNNQQQGGLIGAGAGGALGGLLGKSLGHSGTSTALGAGFGILAGYFVGSAIGQRLDEADQKRAAAATEKVLNKPIRHVNGHAVSSESDWHGHESGVSGKSEVTEVTKETGGGECRMVHEVAYIHGDEVSQNTKYCRDPSGQWQAAGSA